MGLCFYLINILLLGVMFRTRVRAQASWCSNDTSEKPDRVDTDVKKKKKRCLEFRWKKLGLEQNKNSSNNGTKRRCGQDKHRAKQHSTCPQNVFVVALSCAVWLLVSNVPTGSPGLDWNFRHLSQQRCPKRRRFSFAWLDSFSEGKQAGENCRTNVETACSFLVGCTPGVGFLQNALRSLSGGFHLICLCGCFVAILVPYRRLSTDHKARKLPFHGTQFRVSQGSRQPSWTSRYQCHRLGAYELFVRAETFKSQFLSRSKI